MRRDGVENEVTIFREGRAPTISFQAPKHHSAIQLPTPRPKLSRPPLSAIEGYPNIFNPSSPNCAHGLPPVGLSLTQCAASHVLSRHPRQVDQKPGCLCHSIAVAAGPAMSRSARSTFTIPPSPSSIVHLTPRPSVPCPDGRLLHPRIGTSRIMSAAREILFNVSRTYAFYNLPPQDAPEKLLHPPADPLLRHMYTRPQHHPPRCRRDARGAEKPHRLL
jgi:hypothetical protein